MAFVPLQILSLFRGYDMSWPHSTSKVLAWAGALNVSFALTAPEVWQITYSQAYTPSLPILETEISASGTHHCT